jgi:tripartite-type tricarboxylate transporter receptor subunit TctC
VCAHHDGEWRARLRGVDLYRRGGAGRLPQDIVTKLNSAINQSLASPQVAAAFAKLGAEVRPGPPQAFAAFLAAETQKWSQVAKTANIQLE